MRLCLTEVVDLLHCTLFDESHFCSTETIHDDTERGNMQRAWGGGDHDKSCNRNPY